jgi:hypothetical protein
MSESTSFLNLRDSLKSDNRTAVEEVVRRFYGRVVAVVRGRIGPNYRAKIDAEDIANSAMKSFLGDLTYDRLALTDWQDLWNLIAKIALNKLSNSLRRFQQQSRDVGREVGYEGQDGVRVANSPELDAIATNLYARW